MSPRPNKESIGVEFKSDRSKLSDRDLIEAVVCLANAEGGVIYLGVEDDGIVTGFHGERTSIDHFAAMVANRTSPPVMVQAQALEERGKIVSVRRTACLTTHPAAHA